VSAERDNERDTLLKCAIGRLFLLGSRPTQPGDVEEYERIRAIVLDNTEPQPLGYQPNYARDYHYIRGSGQ